MSQKVEHIKGEPILLLVDMRLAQSKNRRLAGFFESYGWSNVLVQDPYGQDTYVQNDPIRSMISLVKRLSNQLQNTANQSTADDLAGRRVHIMLTLFEVKQMIQALHDGC